MNVAKKSKRSKHEQADPFVLPSDSDIDDEVANMWSKGNGKKGYTKSREVKWTKRLSGDRVRLLEIYDTHGLLAFPTPILQKVLGAPSDDIVGDSKVKATGVVPHIQTKLESKAKQLKLQIAKLPTQLLHFLSGNVSAINPLSCLPRSSANPQDEAKHAKFNVYSPAATMLATLKNFDLLEQEVWGVRKVATSERTGALLSASLKRC